MVPKFNGGVDDGGTGRGTKPIWINNTTHLLKL